jgi:hypothetical protein
MRVRNLSKVGGIAILLLAASQANAVQDTDAATASLAITMSMTLQSAITLTLSGQTPTNLSNETDGTGANIAFGNVNTTCSTQPSLTGKCIRITSGGTGAHVVANVIATVTVAGVTPADGNVGISVPAAAPAGLAYKYFLCPANSCNQTFTDPTWAAFGAGTTIPTSSSGFEIGQNIASGNSVQHQLAIQIADTVVPPVANVVVTYTAVP